GAGRAGIRCFGRTGAQLQARRGPRQAPGPARNRPPAAEHRGTTGPTTVPPEGRRRCWPPAEGSLDPAGLVEDALHPGAPEHGLVLHGADLSTVPQHDALVTSADDPHHDVRLTTARRAVDEIPAGPGVLGLEGQHEFRAQLRAARPRLEPPRLLRVLLEARALERRAQRVARALGTHGEALLAGHGHARGK